ncbi:MAG: dienelactone hydrolase family protein [Dehalococcoidia bacterium]
MYTHLGHGFHCDERTSYSAEASRNAWARTLDGFQKYL